MVMEERRKRFSDLLGHYRGQSEAAEKLGFSSPQPVSNLKNGHKNMGEDVARRVEEKAGLPAGALVDPLNIMWPFDFDDDQFTGVREPSFSDNNYSNSMDVRSATGGAYVQSFEYWKGLVKNEIRQMSVSKIWLATSEYKIDQLKTIEMPDDSQSDRIRKGDTVVVCVDWGGTLKHDTLYAVRLGGQYTLRRTAHQANGNILLRCRNRDYADETIESSSVDKLDILGEFVRFEGLYV